MLMIKWQHHGGFDKADMKMLIERSTAIVSGSLEITAQEPVEYSTGDAQIPIVFRVIARIHIHEWLCGQARNALVIEGRSRPYHPDQTVEDRFWVSLEAGRECVLFLEKDDVIGIELATSGLIASLRAAIGDSGRCPSEEV
jgi:hypothetical protein